MSCKYVIQCIELFIGDNISDLLTTGKLERQKNCIFTNLVVKKYPSNFLKIKLKNTIYLLTHIGICQWDARMYVFDMITNTN